jgi:hypothetical protein
VHAYIVDGFKRVPLLLNLQRLFGGGTKLKPCYIDTKIIDGVWGLDNIIGYSSKLTCFGSNGVVVFTGI